MSGASAWPQSMVFDSNNILYLAYQKMGDKKVSVKKYTSAGWQYVGNTSLSDGDVKSVSLAIDSTDTLYLAYIDKVNDYNVTVLKYSENNNTWDSVGKAWQGSSAGLSLAIDWSDTPHILYVDPLNGARCSVKKFNEMNNSWERVEKRDSPLIKQKVHSMLPWHLIRMVLPMLYTQKDTTATLMKK